MSFGISQTRRAEYSCVNNYQMIHVYPAFTRAMNRVHVLWLTMFSGHCYLVSNQFWESGWWLVFMNVAFLAVGAILRVRPGSLKEWGRPSRIIYHLFSLGYLVAMLLAMSSLYDLHYIGV